MMSTTNLTSKSLVMFIRKRDPRYVKETVDEAKLQASLLAASQSQAARAKAAFQENLDAFQSQDWMQPEQILENSDDDAESEVEEEFECVACKKVYKNEKFILYRVMNSNSRSRQFQAHLKGKKHIRAVQALRREMREEDASLDGLIDPGTSNPETSFSLQSDKNEVDSLGHDASEVNVEAESMGQSSEDEMPRNERDREDEIGSVQGDEDNYCQVNEPGEESETELERGLDNLYLGRGKKDRRQPHIDNKPKIGAAKAKRQKRAEKVAALEAEGKLPPKPSKSRKPVDPSAAMQKARGEIATSGRRQAKKK